jgi:hypothetical protein
MRLRRQPACAIALLLAGVPALAQFRGGWRRHYPALTPSRQAAVAQLLQSARREAEAAPAWAAPQLLVAVARAELPHFRAQALADDTAAFQLAVALPTPADLSTPAGQAQERIKENAELEAVSELARNAGEPAALALVRVADVPKAPLYDQLLLAGHMRSAEALNLVEECELQGAFPYRGAAVLLERGRFRGFDLTALVTGGYLHAGDETDPAQYGAAAFFLESGRRAAPALDGPLKTAALELLRRVAGDPFAAPASAGPFGRVAGLRLLALLRQVDPQRAAQWAADHPGASLSGPGWGGGGYPGRLAVAGGLTVTLRMPLGPRTGFAAGAAASGRSPVANFLAHLNQAVRDRRTNPDAALTEADQAAGLVNADLLAVEAPAAARLALMFDRLGDTADAGTLMAKCLDAAGRLARQADAAFDNANAAGQAQQALHLQAASWQVSEIYGLAGEFDLPSATARAESANFTLDKPLVLARLAIIAQLRRPPRN